jgi:hypothetical protein
MTAAISGSIGGVGSTTMSTPITVSTLASPAARVSSQSPGKSGSRRARLHIERCGRKWRS